MKHFLLLFYCVLFSWHAKSQQGNQVFKIDTIKAYIYLIDIFKKEVYSDSTYSYSTHDDLQIVSCKKLSKKELDARMEQKIIFNSLNDTLCIDGDFLYLDYLKHNDNINYLLLRPIQEKCTIIKHAQNQIKNYYSKVENIEFKYRIECINAVWFELKIDRDLAEMILGRSIRYFNNDAKECNLLVLYKQIDSYHL